MFETAMLESGFNFDEPAGFAGRLFNMVRSNMGISAEEQMEPEVAEDEEVEEAVEEVEAGPHH